MKSKSARLVRRNHARYHQGRDDLNIVPMIDMMVILVFFLIFTAVFSKTNILQLNLPAASDSVPQDLPKTLKLEVIIRPDDIEKAMDESLLEVIPRIEKRTHYLSSLANVGLLIGLLGTITGLIGAFSAVATANPAEKASLLAAAISVAMNNTASGLAVAITLLTAHMFLESKTTSLIDSLEIASVKFLNSITERQHEPTAAAQAPAPASRSAAAPARSTI